MFGTCRPGQRVIVGPYGTLTDGTILRTSTTPGLRQRWSTDATGRRIIRKTEKTPEEKPVRRMDNNPLCVQPDDWGCSD